jgi:hypothetical protein
MIECCNITYNIIDQRLRISIINCTDIKTDRLTKEIVTYKMPHTILNFGTSILLGLDKAVIDELNS